MEEKKLYHQIPRGKNKFHSAILTSFSFNFHHFEYQVLKTLKKKWVTNIGIFVDSNMLDDTLGLASGGLRQLTQSYSVDSIKVAGAFHPKINFLIGDKELLMIMGSGNITPGGHGKNHEGFLSFYADSLESVFLPILIETWKYIQNIASNVKGYSNERIMRIVPKNCELLRNLDSNVHTYSKVDNDTEIAVLYNDSTSIFKQLLALIPTDNIKLITIVCPYFDVNGQLLLNLLEKFPNAELKVFIPEKYGLLPYKMDYNKRITFLKWEATSRGKMTINGVQNFYRKLHCKIYNFHSYDYEYCLIGSANATLSAFGSMSFRGINEEFVAVYKSKKLNFLTELGIDDFITIKNLSGYSNENSIKLNDRSTKRILIRILSCDLLGLTLKVYLEEKLTEQFSLIIYNDVGTIIFSEHSLKTTQEVLSVNINSECLTLNPAYVILESAGSSLVSNKKVINFLDKLYNTDPSKESRKIRGILGCLELGQINEFQIMSLLLDMNVEKNLINDHLRHSKKDFTSVYENVHPEMSYEEAILASKNKDVSIRVNNLHYSTRLWAVFKQLFKDRKNFEIEELSDEEEDGEAHISRERKSHFKVSETETIKDKAHFNSIVKKSEKLANFFIQTTEKIHYDKKIKINEISLCQFLLISHIITVIHHFTQYELPYNSEQKKFKYYTPNEWKKILEASYTSIMQKVLLAFSKFISFHEKENYSDDNYQEIKFSDYAKNAISHSLICHYLINHDKMDSQCEMSDLACLNIFKKLGFPDENFVEYIESISLRTIGGNFNFINVIRLSSRLKGTQLKLTQKKKMFDDQKYGICLIKEIDSKYIYFRSILTPNKKERIPVKSFLKQYKILPDVS